MPDEPKLDKQLENKAKLPLDPYHSRNERLIQGLEEGRVCVYCGPSDLDLIRMMAQKVGDSGRVVLIENENSLYELIEKSLEPYKQVIFTEETLGSLQVGEAYSDFSLSLFSMEYSPSPESDFEKIHSITKSGGKIILGEFDGIHLSHYPLPRHLQTQLDEIAEKCESARLWNPFVGRSLFQFFNEGELRDIQADLIPYHLLCGHMDREDYEAWKTRMDFFQSAEQRQVVSFSFDFKAFRRELIAFFDNPNRFSYSTLILVEALKAS